MAASGSIPTMTVAKEPLVAGIDGCKGGWVVIRLRGMPFKLDFAEVVPTFEAALHATDSCAKVAVDIPIGLLDAREAGGREAERKARNILGSGRKSSVFSSPIRPVLDAQSHAEANALTAAKSQDGKGLSIQSYAIVQKIREVDHEMSRKMQGRVVETHPELGFEALNGGTPLVASKSTAAGLIQRLRLLATAGLGDVVEKASLRMTKGASLDDVLDATVCCWTAHRVATGKAERIPEVPPIDSHGLRMEMWF